MRAAESEEQRCVLPITGAAVLHGQGAQRLSGEVCDEAQWAQPQGRGPPQVPGVYRLPERADARSLLPWCPGCTKEIQDSRESVRLGWHKPANPPLRSQRLQSLSLWIFYKEEGV